MKEKQNTDEKKKSQDRIQEIINEYANGSQQELADACGVAKSSISQYVNRTNSPGNMTAAKIGKRYGLNPLWIMGFDVPKTAKESADEFRKFADSFNDRRHQKIISMNLSDSELSMIEKYRYIDDYGKRTVNVVLDSEYDRCKDESERTIELSEDEIERLKIEKYLNGNTTLLVARKRKGD